MSETVLLCDCLGSQRVNRDELETASGRSCSKVHTFLCGRELGHVAEAMASGPVTISCEQERATFESLAEEIGADAPACVDLRDRAGWSDDPRDVTPKQAALLADAAMPRPTPRSIDVESEGTCLVIGASDVALPAARRLADTLAVTCLLTDAAPPPETRAFDMIHGRLRKATGALGQFSVTIDGFAQLVPGGRGGFDMSPPRDDAKSECDIILDLSGDRPLFPAHEKREGYLRADPGRPEAVFDATLAARDLTGTFEQPVYIRLREDLCAHSRAQQTGCTKCLDACPTGAITPDGDHVAVDPHVCAGCGACSSLCPSGAITYDAPPVDDTMRRIATLARTYRAAGGTLPRLLVHDEGFGREMIDLLARHGAGLPSDVIPFALPALAAFGHAEALSARVSGFADVSLLLSPMSDRATLEQEAALASAIDGPAALRLLDVGDPDALPAALGPAPETAPEPMLSMGSRRQVARLAAKALAPEAITPLPAHAPYGAVLVDPDACTLCLACVPNCPSGALSDNPDKPQLLFTEDACLQCGLCANICPEDAITLEPRMNTTDAALSPAVMREEEPFHCVECGTPFGVKSTIDRITERLAGKHAMFARPEAVRLIQMCDDCRVKSQMHEGMLSGPPKPVTRTSADYGQPADAVVLPKRRKKRRTE
ncbi:4Fe-4S dicluster domain-containing protein [Palleronia marisminoris]|uniref:Formate hydrogenlyase complex iron-sulfur subunit n=1 Tax=Palleronia marisminoris TaxID=315423 RepID=A0A1Y5TIA6_9RHOB|nr:4Fe-4S binding protein [Palleronia marisminoris]SFH40182.1 4Fe-4S dicluster domain-containing protein [Palleronia marisminoris]SLN64947.1 formate hydrogenlyase complex iron-sulfur subunit [Palleronia marisminoris]